MPIKRHRGPKTGQICQTPLQKEEEKVEKVQKTKEDEIRDRLRSFTRTIPMFIMANDSKDEITIDNFDLEIEFTKSFRDKISPELKEIFVLTAPGKRSATPTGVPFNSDLNPSVNNLIAAFEAQ